MIASNFWIRFTLAVLATWRMSHILASEDGPADLIVKLRALLGQSFAGRLMDCFYCLSLWIAAPAALYVTRQWTDWLMTWLAISGAACLLKQLTERLGKDTLAAQPASPPSEGDEYVLRSETIGIPKHLPIHIANHPPAHRNQ